MRLRTLYETKARHCAAKGMKCLTKKDLYTLARHLPSVDKEEIDELLYKLMRDDGRLPGGHREELEYLGLCGEVSSRVRDLLKSNGAVYKTGRFEITPNKGDIHCWVELDGKIIDFTASQFNPWLEQDVPDLLIIDKTHPFAKHYVALGTAERAEDFEYVFSSEGADERIMQKYLDKLG